MSFQRFSLSIAAVISVCLAAGCSGKKENSKPEQKPVPVSVITAEARDVPEWHDVMGQTEGASQVEIRSQVTGTLKRIAYREGDQVKKGDLLFEIDPVGLEAERRAAEASLLEARTKSEQASRELARNKALAARNAIPAKELDDAASAAKSAAASVTAAQARLENARFSLSHARITAPDAGVMSLSSVNPGALVSAQNTVLATLTQKTKLRVNFAMSDRDLAGASLTLANPVEVVNSKGERLKASLDYVAQQINPAQGTRSMRAALSDPAGLLSGEFVRVRIVTGTEKNVFLIPQSAVIQGADGLYSLYVLKEGKARKIPVRVGPWNETNWIVRSGLQNGDQVIVNQILKLRDGRDVRVGTPGDGKGGSAASKKAGN